MTVKKVNFFNKIQPTWNDVYKNNNVFNLPWVDKDIKPELKKVIDNLPFRTGRALDVGCGLGQVSRYLALSGFDVTAIDISNEAILWANKLNSTGKTINYQVADSITYNSKKKFNLVVDFLHIHDIEKVNLKFYLQNINNLLKSDGILIVASFSQLDPSNSKNNYRPSLFVDQNVFYYNVNELIDLLGNNYIIKDISTFEAGKPNMSYHSNIYLFHKL